MIKGLSIIIPITNRAEILRTTLKSYRDKNDLNNTNYEIIILSHNNTDNLQTILNEFSDMNIIHQSYNYKLEGWCNPALAFNIGATFLNMIR